MEVLGRASRPGTVDGALTPLEMTRAENTSVTGNTTAARPSSHDLMRFTPRG
ncbi:MAG TPA: hypothetical protein VKA30_11140 [Actinomycetota bacterium]|nr:hypothetical protein [Actinomycetota bacterium]